MITLKVNGKYRPYVLGFKVDPKLLCLLFVFSWMKILTLKKYQIHFEIDFHKTNALKFDQMEKFGGKNTAQFHL